MVRLVLVLVCAVALASCGDSDSQPDPKQAYLGLEKALAKGDSAACEQMTGDYKNKLAASTELFSSDCTAVVRKVARGFRDDPELRTKSIDHVRVTGNSATLIAHSTYEGADVRTKATFTKRPGGAWMLSKDQILDAAAPKAPLVAYESYAAALAKGSSERACALTTMRGRELLANAIAQPHGGSTCEGAIPFLAVAAGQQPEAEVIDGEEAADSAELYALQSIAHRGWAFRVITMKRENGAWRYESSRNLGIAPSVVAPHGPVT